MAVVQILAFLLAVLGIAKKFQLKFVEAVPVGTSLLVMLLYGLSFFRALSLSDYLAAAFLLFVLIRFIRASRDEKRNMLSFGKDCLTEGGALTALLMTAVVTICVGSKLVSWWDDYNFWATDVKSIYYLDGFAGKYTNVAPEFGDYPPATQMIKWWFLHFSPGQFKEGLMFGGYYFMMLSFLFPLLSFLQKKNPIKMLLGGAALWLFPAVAEAFWLDGCCADLIMAVIYGAFLTAVCEERREESLLYYGRQALYLMVLVLCKNTGILWAVFGLIFSFGYQLLKRRRTGEDLQGRKRVRRAFLIVSLLTLSAEGSWLLFCLMNRRVAKLTGTAIKMATGSLGIPEYQDTMVKAFLEAFVSWPLHRGKTPALDLSPLGLYLILLLVVALFYKFRIWNRKKAVYMGCFFGISGLVFYGFNLVSHLTIFAVETQYLEPFGMVSSIERYGAPFTIGGLYLLADTLLRNGQKNSDRKYRNAGAYICLAFVLLTTDYAGAYRAIWGYREKTDEILSEREEIVDQDARDFLNRIGAGTKKSPGRVLYLRDSSDVSWVRNTYISFEAAPVSVMYGNIDPQNTGAEDVAAAVREAHAGYLYVEELTGSGAFLSELLPDGSFEYGRLYQVTEEGESLFLKEPGQKTEGEQE